MPDQPYTTTDLIAEAIRQHAGLAEDPDFTGVGEAMEDSVVDSTDDGTCARQTWNELLVAPTPNDEYEAYSTAQQKIHDLITGAADVSAWAVQLGADGLQPEDHTLSVDGDGKPLVRLHCAFHPDLDDAARTAFVSGLAQVLADGM